MAPGLLFLWNEVNSLRKLVSEDDIVIMRCRQSSNEVHVRPDQRGAGRD